MDFRLVKFRYKATLVSQGGEAAGSVYKCRQTFSIGCYDLVREQNYDWESAAPDALG